MHGAGELDLEDPPVEWSLGDLAAAVVVGALLSDLGNDRGYLARVVLEVSRAWYADERSGFNAEQIAIGGEG